jgi:hypothetical protein
MGQSSSSNYVEKDWEREAAINFNKRIKAYNYAYHGMYYDYVEWCRAQYELECIPEWCRQGRGYRPQYDHYGRQVY